MRKPPVRLLILGFFIVAPIVLLILNQGSPDVVRGKASSVPRTELSDEALHVQDLALADARVLAQSAGQRTEVFTVDYLGNSYLPAPECDCWQVSIYHFEKNASVVALVDAATDTVIDVQLVQGMQPGIPPRLQDRAVELIQQNEMVAEELGYQLTKDDIAPMHGSLANTECGVPHLCVAANFWVGERIFWVFVDLTEEAVVGTRWGNPEPALRVEPGNTPANPLAGGCPAPGSVKQDGWAVFYETTDSDGFRVYNVTYNGAPVLTSSKAVEWHADYGGFGFVDAVGCAASGGGFPISPYGETQILQLPNGFELVQDFRMNNWGAFCNYRYEQHYRFYADGTFRVVAGAYGKGCYGDTAANYHPLIRIDIAPGSDDNNDLYAWDGNTWQAKTTEFIECPEFDAACEVGPYPVTSDLYRWFITGPSGNGYYIEPGQGQFLDERADDQYFYATLHKTSEGDADLGGSIGSCCLGDYRQGPHLFVDDESIVDANIVLWYVPQLLTDLAPDNYYCWTVTVNETYPCFGGPRFSPSLELDIDRFLPTIRND